MKTSFYTWNNWKKLLPSSIHRINLSLPYLVVTSSVISVLWRKGVPPKKSDVSESFLRPGNGSIKLPWMSFTQPMLPRRAARGGSWLVFCLAHTSIKAHDPFLILLFVNRNRNSSRSPLELVWWTPARDTAAHPRWIPCGTRHGTREKRTIRGLHLKEPVRCFLAWKYRDKSLIFLQAWNFPPPSLISVVRLWAPRRQRTLTPERSAAPDPGGDSARHGVRMVSSDPIMSSLLALLCCLSPAIGKQSFTLAHMCAGIAIGPDRTG